MMSLVSDYCLLRIHCDATITMLDTPGGAARVPSSSFERPTQGRGSLLRRLRLVARRSEVRSVHHNDGVAVLDVVDGVRAELDEPVVGI